MTISNSTIVGNNAPGGTAGGLMVATFGAPVSVSIADNIIADNGTYNCQVEGGGAAVLTSLGGNVVDRRVVRSRSAATRSSAPAVPSWARSPTTAGRP